MYNSSKLDILKEENKPKEKITYYCVHELCVFSYTHTASIAISETNISHVLITPFPLLYPNKRATRNYNATQNAL